MAFVLGVVALVLAVLALVMPAPPGWLLPLAVILLAAAILVGGASQLWHR